MNNTTLPSFLSPILRSQIPLNDLITSYKPNSSTSSLIATFISSLLTYSVSLEDINYIEPINSISIDDDNNGIIIDTTLIDLLKRTKNITVLFTVQVKGGAAGGARL